MVKVDKQITLERRYIIIIISSVVSNSLRPHGLQPTGLFRPWDFPDKNTGVGCHFLLQGNFPTQGSNPGLPHYRQTLYHLSHKGSPGEKIDGFKVKVTLVSGWTQANNLLRQLWKHSQSWEVNKKQGDKIKGIFLQKSGQILIRMP